MAAMPADERCDIKVFLDGFYFRAVELERVFAEQYFSLTDDPEPDGYRESKKKAYINLP